MNIKNYSLKAMCAALACTTVLSSMLAAYATNTTVYETPMDDSAEINSINTLSNDSVGTDSSDSGWTTEENSFEDIKVTYQQSSSYAVTIPKTIALDSKKQAAYSVKVSGDIDANQRVYVAPVDGITDSENLDFYMSDLSGKKANVVAMVIQNKTYWNSEDVMAAYEETNNSVSAPDLTAGTWEGTFKVEIRLETEKAHEHNYVDGKCTICGNKCNHNWQGTTCTICGETDEYAVAPTNAYNNWAYTLDDENNIITLNYYIGSETNVIVYGNYVIDGKTYKTQLSSNSASVTGSPTTAITVYSYMFNGYGRSTCKKITSIKFSHSIDTSNVTNMDCMFSGCDALIDLDISGFDTSNVTSMEYMFSGCQKLTSLDLSNFDTGNVINMRGMFQSSNALTDLDLSNFNTENVTTMRGMFYGCSALTSLNISSFDTSNVTDMNSMFYTCRSLTSLDLGNFNTSNVTDMGYMFSTCSNLASLDLSSFDTRNATRMDEMFRYCGSLKTIYVTEGKWSTSQASASIAYMFSGCGTSSVTYK